MNLKEQILELRSQGKTYLEITNALGCSKSTVSYYCGSDQKEKTRIRTSQTRSKRFELVRQIKSVPCMDCKNSYPSECMDFDHVKGDKVEKISQMVMHGKWEDVLIEIEKCEIVCSNCHRIRTKMRRTDDDKVWMI